MKKHKKLFLNKKKRCTPSTERTFGKLRAAFYDELISTNQFFLVTPLQKGGKGCLS
jgi:hypothetical protein